MNGTRATNAGDDVEIVIKQVWHRFPRLDSNRPLLALRDINLEIAHRRFVAVLGSSGCGKSTLLRIIAGLVQPTQGQVIHRGAIVQAPHHSRGFVFQADAVFPWLTVRRNVEFGLRNRGVDRATRREISAHWCGVVGLSDFIDAYPKELSGGMRKRVDLARAYANDPEVLLMDEPFGALDAQTKERMQMELLNTWEQAKTTVVFVTHDVDEAIFLADEVVVMSSRPGEIASRIPVTLDRPRTEETRVSDGFASHRRAIRHAMLEVHPETNDTPARAPP